MSRYLQILSTQRPFPFDVDDNQRNLFIFNIEAKAASNVDKWEEELAQVLIGDLVATALGNDIFAGLNAPIPDGDGPYIQLIDTGGSSPDETHNGDVYENLSCQIVIRSKSYALGRTKALAVWRSLHGVRNTTVAAP